MNGKHAHRPTIVLILSGMDKDAIATETASRGIKATDHDTACEILGGGIRTLDDLTATLVNVTGGTIDADTLRDYMVRAFPGHKIGDRHGKHYLSLARTGSLSGDIAVRFAVPMGSRKPGKAGISGMISDIPADKMAEILKAAEGTPLAVLLSRK